MAVLDVRWNSQITATLNLVRTAFIVAALALGITLMQRDAARLVLRPMERMLSKVRAVAENPLATKRARLESRGVPEREKLMETRILENAINKICSLLAVGFGDAGAEVIAGNMRSGGELDPVVPGRRVAGIFGFCDIRQFTDATEVLQEEVMGFVNTIARIVHREVSLHGGAPNKNIGDAFLLVWKFPDGVDDASLAEALKYVEAQESGSAGGGGGEGGGGDGASAVAPGRELDIAITLQKVRRRERESFLFISRFFDAFCFWLRRIERERTERKKKRERARERAEKEVEPPPLFFSLKTQNLTLPPPQKKKKKIQKTHSTGPPPRRPGPRLLPHHPGRPPPLSPPPRAHRPLRRPGEAARLRRPDGLRPARRLGDRGRDRQRVQDRRVVPVAQRQHGVEARGGDQAVRDEPADVRGLCEAAEPRGQGEDAAGEIFFFEFEEQGVEFFFFFVFLRGWRSTIFSFLSLSLSNFFFFLSQIDVVTVKGSAVPMSLHTYDFDVSQAPGPRLFLEEGVLQMQQQQQQQQAGAAGADADADAANSAVAAQAAAAAAALARQQHQHQQLSMPLRARGGGGRHPTNRAHNRLDAAALLAATDGGDADDAETFSHRPYSSEFDEHPDLAPTWAVDRDFLDAFGSGFAKYRMGQWEEARAELLRTLHWPKGMGNGGGSGNGGGGGSGGGTGGANDNFSGPPDGPSAALLRFMESHKFVPPKAWRGFRELTEK